MRINKAAVKTTSVPSNLMAVAAAMAAPNAARAKSSMRWHRRLSCLMPEREVEGKAWGIKEELERKRVKANKAVASTTPHQRSKHIPM